MRRSVRLGVLGVLAVAGSVLPARGATCPGDCSGTMQVKINDLVTCVSIALGSLALSACTACDVDDSKTVTVNELVAAVNAALDGCPGTTPIALSPTATPVGPSPTPTTVIPICGNNVIEADEDCDPPKVGNGCAANCTFETARTANLDPTTSLSPIQTIGGVLSTIHVSGTQVLTTGRARDKAVFGPGNQPLFAPGEAPIVIKAADVKFDPVNVLGLACACIRAIPVAAFGDGISGVGVAGCGDQGLTNINFLVEEDHDTTHGSPGNGGSDGLPDDPGCNAHSVGSIEGTLAAVGAGIVSDACLEGVDQACAGLVGTASQYSTHYAVPSCVGGPNAGMTCKVQADCGTTCIGGSNDGNTCKTATDCSGGVCPSCKTGPARPAACNSPRTYTFSGGPAPRGSVLLVNSTSQTLLPGQGGVLDACKDTTDIHGNCKAPAFGLDCKPCTDDDIMMAAPMIVPTTSGIASVKIYDANDSPTILLGDGGNCGKDAQMHPIPCKGSVKGIVADCDELKNDPNAPLSGALVTASPTLDSEVGDVALTTTLQSATPTPSGDRTE